MELNEETISILSEFALDLEESGRTKERLEHWMRNHPELADEFLRIFVDEIRLEEVVGDEAGAKEPFARWDMIKASGESELRRLLYERDRGCTPKRRDGTSGK